ncbi:MAG TPA: MFS transporter [Ktedonobacteraceae bacterium]|nr:MFS transporter [Ktedonobacteraceae bacterium]
MSTMRDDSREIEDVEQAVVQAGSAEAGGQQEIVPLWRNRDFLLLTGGQAVSLMGSQVSQLAFPLLMLALTHSPAQAGFMAAVRGLPFALLCLPAGALVDRWNRKRVMILCDTGRALALGSIPLALLLGHLTFVQLYLVALTEGTLFVFFNMADAASLPHIVAKRQLPDATAQALLAESVSSLLGPALGGLLYGIATMLPFGADAVSYAVSVFSLFFIRAEFQEEWAVTQKQNLWKEIGAGLHWLWHEPLVRFIAILTGGITFPVVGYGLILIVIAQRQHASPSTIGLIFGCGGIGSILGALLAGPLQRRFSFAQMLIGATWVWALTWLLFAIAPNPFVLGIVTALSFIVVPIYTGTQYSYRMAVIPDALQGRVNSVFRLIAFGTQPLGLTLTGVLLQAIGPVATVLALFIPQFILSIAVTFNQHVRDAKPISEMK